MVKNGNKIKEWNGREEKEKKIGEQNNLSKLKNGNNNNKNTES